MKLRSAELVILGVTIAFVLIPFFVTPSHAAEPSLVQILENLGFTNIAQSSAQTFPASTYNITLLAEFAGWHQSNELSYYELNYPNVFNVIFTGAEGNEGYTDPPINKLFTADYEFGFSLLVPGPNRYFTENNRNEWSIQHAKVYENLDDPGMYFIGFENQYGWWGDRDYNDMVFSIKPYVSTVENYLTVETDPAYIITISGEDWYDNCTYVNLTAPDFVPASGFRYRFDYWDVDGTPQGSNPITVHMDANHTAIANYVAQYYLNVISPYDTPGGEGWYDSCTYANATLLSGVIDYGNETRRVFVDWSGDASGTNYAKSNPIYMNQNKTATANWKTQYYLTMDTNFGTVSPSDGWYDAGSIITISATPPSTIPGERYVWNGWTGTGTGSYTGLDNPPYVTMNAPVTETASWTHQNYLTVNSPHGTPGGEGWYDNGDTAYATVTPLTVSGPTGVHYVFIHWGDDASGTTSPSNPITMDGPKTATASWKIQYYLTLTTTSGGITDPASSAWYDSGSLVQIMAIPDTDYLFDHWELDAVPVGSANPYNVLMDDVHDLHAVFLYSPTPPPNYYLTVLSAYDTRGGEGWYVNGSTAYASLNTGIVDHGNGTRRVFTHWGGDASGTDYAQSDPITMNANKTAVANWKTQYYLTVNSPYGTPGIEGWYDSGDTAYASLSTGMVDHGNGTRRIFTSWTGDASGTDYVQSDPITIDQPKTAVASWKTQYYLTLTTDPGSVTTPSSEGWYDAGAYASISTNALVDIVPGSSRYNFSGWTTADMPEITDPASPSTTVLMDKPKTVTANYKTQYMITFDQSGVGVDFTGTVVSIDRSNYGVGDLSISFWWDSGTDHSYSFASPLVVNVSKQYVWISTSGLSTSQSDTLTVTNSGSITGHYSTGTEYQITFDQVGVDSDFTDTIVIIDGTPYNRLSLPVSFWWDVGTMHSFSFLSPLVVTPDAKQYVWESTTGISTLQTDSITVTMSSSVTGNYKIQFYLTVDSLYDSPTPTSGWFDEGTSIIASVTSPVSGPANTQYVCTGWTGTGSVLVSGATTSITFTINEPSSITWNWKTQYYLTLTTTSGGITNPSSSGWHDVGTIVSAAAIPDTYYLFDHWALDSINIGSANPYDVTIDTAHTLHAVFVQEMSTLTVTATPGGTTDLSPGSYVYPAGTNVVVTALPSPNYVFDHWEFDGLDVGSANPYTVFLNPDHALHAVFVYSPPLPPSSPVVGGSTVSIKSPLLPTWIGLNVVLIATIFITASWIKRWKK